MKYLKYILILIVVLVAGFFLMGMISPSHSYENEIVVDKPLEETWAVAQDPDKLGDWLEGFIKIEHVSGEPGTVGAVSDVYFEQDGEEMMIRETITEIVENESISMTFTSDFMDMDYVMNVSKSDGKTKINSSTIVEGNGMVSKSIIALMSGMFVDQEQTNLESLKKTIENNTKDYFPRAEPVMEVMVDSLGSASEDSVAVE